MSSLSVLKTKNQQPSFVDYAAKKLYSNGLASNTVSAHKSNLDDGTVLEQQQQVHSPNKKEDNTLFLTERTQTTVFGLAGKAVTSSGYDMSGSRDIDPSIGIRKTANKFFHETLKSMDKKV